jgi:hypothetical protein
MATTAAIITINAFIGLTALGSLVFWTLARHDHGTVHTTRPAGTAHPLGKAA